MTNSQNENWTEIIRPKRNLLDINLKELWFYRDLIMLFVKRDFVSVYKQTILGPIWLFIQPLFTSVIFYFIFNKVAKISTNGIDPLLFYLCGITFWTYFSDCLTKTSNTFVANAGIFGKVYFPRLTSPVSITISNLIKLGIQILLLLCFFLYKVLFENMELNINLSILLLPLYILIFALLGLGLGIIFSSLTTKYRDLGFLLTFGVQLFMYATPIIYPLSYTEGTINKLIRLNPLTPLLENIRFALFNSGTFDGIGLIYTSVVTLVVLSFGIIIFNRVEKSFMDTV